MNRLILIFFTSIFTLSCSAAPEKTIADNVNINATTTTLPQNPSSEASKEDTSIIEQMVEEEETVSKESTPVEKVVEQKSTTAVKQPKVTIETEAVEIESVESVIAEAKPDHAAFDQMLQSHVSSSGVVNYSNWKNDLGKLDSYLENLAENEPASDWSRSEKMAYWINLYNASTVKLILDNMPVKSIMNIDGGKPWDRKWIKVGTNTYSLNQVEHDILRPNFGDARIHFAVNCAAKSCPPIHNRAFTSTNLNATLERLTRKFINDTTFNKTAENRLQLSNIFNWYKDDFGDLAGYIDKYTETEIKSKAKITFIDYDWALNGK